MEVSESQIRAVIEQVVHNLDLTSAAPSAPSAPSGAPAGVFADIDGAVAAARTAQEKLIQGTLELRREMIRSMRDAIIAQLEKISRLAVEETGMGRWQDKVLKNQLAALKTPGVEDLQPTCYTDDHGLTLTEWAPYGVIGAIAPSTNPTETIINNALGMIAGGNTVVFNAHPAARQVSALTVAVLNEAIMKVGGPADCVTTTAEPSIETAQALMNHKDVALLVVTGGPAVVREALKSSKKVIAAGPGNPPCVVDETADLIKAGRDIVRGASLDNNIICICEKEILAVASIADRLKAEMVKNGAFELNRAQTEAISRLVIQEPGGPGREGAANKRYVGKNAHLIAAEIGLVVPERTRLLLSEVERNHPLVWTEQLMPVIPLVRLPNVDEAIDFAKACEHGFRHTAVMHSLNIEKLSKMARVMNCSLFVKNGSAYNGMAQGGAGYTSFTIASPTGEGFTRARTFTRQRRCALIDYFRIV
jgi:acyl-CoA reductase-like NAD-dependent aldehyde dehydrogenase